MDTIGTTMESTIQEMNGVRYPVQRLRGIITGMVADLNWYQSKYPEKNTERRRQLIKDLDSVCRTLEACEPVEVWRMIWEKLGEARKEKYNGDIALVYFPLKPELPRYYEARQIVVDLCGYNLNPVEYDYGRSKFLTSCIDGWEDKA